MILAGSVSAAKHIGPPALGKGNPACSQEKDCGLGKPANKPERGCTEIKQCKGS